MRKIQVVKLGDFYLPDLRYALSCLCYAQYCTFATASQYLPIPDPDYKIANLIEEYSFEQLQRVLNEYRSHKRIHNEVILIGIINRCLERNYFSFSSPLNKCAVIAINDLEKLLGNVSIEEFLISEIAEHTVAIIENHSWHEEPRRCLCDFCGDKRDIIPSMAYRALCESCDSHLSQEAKGLLQRSFDCIKKIDPITTLSQEIRKMTEEPKRVIQTQNYFEQGTHTHTHNYATDETLKQQITELRQLTTHLQRTYEPTTEAEAIEIIDVEFREIKNTNLPHWQKIQNQLQLLKRQLLNPERHLTASKAALAEVAKHYLEESVVSKALITYLDTMSADTD